MGNVPTGFRSVRIEIETLDERLSSDLMGDPSPSAGQIAMVPGDVALHYDCEIVQFAVDVPNVIRIVAAFGGQVALNMFSSWLYDKIKGRATTIRINRRTIQIGEAKSVSVNGIDIEDAKNVRIIEETLKMEE